LLPTEVAAALPDAEAAAEPAARRQPNAVPSEANVRQPDAEVSSTHIGGYAELHLNMERISGPGSRETTVDFHRFVLFLAHEFTESIRFYSELEVEHAVASSDPKDPGEVEIEQAYVDYLLADKALGLRAGLVLVPMGIINQWHEPPVFHGVERPMVDTVIIPTSWREAAVGVFGEPIEGLRYQLYAMSGLSAAGFSASDGIAEGRTETAEAPADGLAVAARVEYEPSPGLVAGVSAYGGLAGPNAEFFDASGTPGDLNVPVLGVAADARGRVAGFEARAELAYFHIGNTRALRNTADEKGINLGLDVGAAIYGLYGEVAYDVLHSLEMEPQLLPFVRVERYDTMASVSGRPHAASDNAFGVTELALGLSYKPVPQLAFKSDLRFSNPDGPTKANGRFDLGLGVMF